MKGKSLNITLKKFMSFLNDETFKKNDTLFIFDPSKLLPINLHKLNPNLFYNTYNDINSFDIILNLYKRLEAYCVKYKNEVPNVYHLIIVNNKSIDKDIRKLLKESNITNLNMNMFVIGE